MSDPIIPGNGDAPPDPISYESFERSVESEPTSTVAPKTEIRSLPSEPKSRQRELERTPSRARQLLDLRRRENEVEQRRAAIEKAESALDPKVRNQRIVQQHAQEAIDHVQQNAESYPLLNAFDGAARVPAYTFEVWRRTGRLPSHAEVAEALEQHLQRIHTRASTAMKDRPPARTSKPAEPDWTDDRRINDDERWRRALASMSIVSRRSR